ncbi:MAG: uroporphyrinogen decarboxylase [Bacteroidetes bacterium]|nr:uroporphyrinogen decarboxylase [Bacteroidota bacterium]MBU1115907.1 uroporphyrinogen decarboxylase [Bacteroidota bacterium]MBU1798734.1 uroporphyrinogen decarboxylase [Bacteroidota bacterium]
MEKLKNDLFLRACKKEQIDRTPIWIMRQAGRYLPEYRKVRVNSDFKSMVKTPELATEVTLQPVDIIGVDAAIIFSDILVIPEALGMNYEMVESRGPSFDWTITHESDFNRLSKSDLSDKLSYVFDAVKLTKKKLNGRVPLIGFSGSPFTLLTYMVEGGGSKNFSQIKSLIFNNPEFAHKLLEFISEAVSEYLSLKIKCGVNAVQIFDTWGGLLSPDLYKEFSLKYIKKVIDNVERTDEPIISYAKGIHHSLIELADSGADVVSIDWTHDIGEVRKLIGNKVALQGNMDPTVLYANTDTIRREAVKVLDSYGHGSGHIFNLGHGILPDISPANTKALVDIVKEESKRYH